MLITEVDFQGAFVVVMSACYAAFVILGLVGWFARLALDFVSHL